MDIKVAVHSQNALGEGPVWSQGEGALYWVDIHKKLLQRWVPSSDNIESWLMPSEIGSLAIRKSGGCLVALRDGFAFVDLDSGLVTPICDLEEDLPFTRFNDGKCDRRGRFWAGTMDEVFPNRRGSLYRLGEDGKCVKVRGNVGISNGLGWSPDNKTFYYTDSSAHAIFAYSYDHDSGHISNERIFVKTPENYVPDGLTVDSDGFIWSAKWDGWKIVRYAPSGRIDLEIPMPVQRPTSCIFGGKNLNKLFITTASIDLGAEELKQQPLAGNVFVVETDAVGLAEPWFAG